MGLISRIQELENKIQSLETQLKNLAANTQEGNNKPYTKTGVNSGKSTMQHTDIFTGLGAVSGNPIVWNDKDTSTGFKKKPDTPTVGYNKHSHSRYSGGALDVNTLELVEYDIELNETEEDDGSEDGSNLYEWNSADFNKHCQNFWYGFGPTGNGPAIKKVQNEAGNNVYKIGTLEITFDAEKKKWVAGISEIDIESVKFIQHKEGSSTEVLHEGKIYDSDSSKTSIVWDDTNSCWRFYAIYAEE